MSRPCFALSVMLCCLAGPLVIIGKAQAREPVVSPGHDPGECILCPLAHGAFEACGGYSDYDYNRYWMDENLASESPAPESSLPAEPELAGPALTAPELESASPATAETSPEAWESEYEDYYADYVYGEDFPSTDADAAADDLNTQDSAATIEQDAQDAISTENATPADADIDYEAYEEEWFSYGAETTVEQQERDVAVDQAAEVLTEPSVEASAAESVTSESEEDVEYWGDEYWGDEEAWYHEEYGDEGSSDEASYAVDAAVPAADSLATGYDAAYDTAMSSEPPAADDVNEAVPSEPATESLDAPDYEADYESFYDAYDDLYNFEPAPPAPIDASQTTEPENEQAATDLAETERAVAAWVGDLVERMLAPLRAAGQAVGTNASESMESLASAPAELTDQCEQEWDCELGYWGEDEVESSSVVLGAADTLDEMATALRKAATYLRGFADGRLAKATQDSDRGTQR